MVKLFGNNHVKYRSPSINISKVMPRLKVQKKHTKCKGQSQMIKNFSTNENVLSKDILLLLLNIKSLVKTIQTCQGSSF
jgi:hypothetical protein